MPRRVIPDGFRLPTKPEDGVGPLLELAKIFGERDFFAFLSLMRNNDGPYGEARSIIAARSVAAFMRDNPSYTYEGARQSVGKDLGYIGTRASNFQRAADNGRDILIESGQWSALTTPEQRS